MKARRAKKISFLISLTTLHISIHLCRSLIPISIYIGIDICKVKNRVYCNIGIHCWNTSSRTPKCFWVLSTQKTFVSASSWSQINSDTHSIRPSFRLNLKICEAQLKKLAGGNKWALRVGCDQSSNKNLTFSDLFWSFSSISSIALAAAGPFFQSWLASYNRMLFFFHVQEILLILVYIDQLRNIPLSLSTLSWKQTLQRHQMRSIVLR